MSHATAKPPAARPGRARRPGRWPVAAGLAASAALHWAVLRLYPVVAGAPADIVPAERALSPLRAVQAVRIVELGPGDPTTEDAPVEIDASVPETATPAAPVLDEGPRFRFPSGHLPAAGRLRPGQGDPRLWVPVAPELVEPTRDELLRMEILIAVEAMADSSASAAEAARRATDWTYTDAEGRKWGAQDGLVYLGGVPLPIPIGFSGPRDVNGDLAARAFRFREIERAAGTRAVQLTWKERLEFMRLRREAQREAEAAEKAASGARRPPPPPKPDTLGRRGPWPLR